MEWQRLETLKEKLQKDDDFQGIWTYFFDHLGENEAFVSVGESANEKVIEFIGPVVARTVSHILGRPIQIMQMQLIEITGQHFYHGSAISREGLCVIMYFDDIKMGMISFTQGLGSGQMHYGRFTTLAVEGAAKKTVILPTNNQTGH
ncbi:MAG: hypothetical protein HOP19_03440 [Acidobacteria bacterium]|nr:hypothetical protein [Acidobacteriota bacterium]